MYGRFPILFSLCAVLGTSSLFAQENKFEINGLIGYTLSEGVDVKSPENSPFAIDRLSPKSGFSFGLGLDYFLSENLSAGFNFGQEKSEIGARIPGLKGLDLTGMNVNNYHVIITYNFGDEEGPLRPFVFGGIGATSYSPDAIEGFSVEGGVKFSTTWGGGVKYFTSDHLGFKGGIRWTPTYIKGDNTSLWCSDYTSWSCWTVEKGNHSHQFEFNIGIVARF
jgi:opacity protein-like surface antigen